MKILLASSLCLWGLASVAAGQISAVVPKGYDTQFGNGSSNLPLGYSPCRYQQVFDGAELPPAFPIRGLGFRFDDVSSALGAESVEFEVVIGYTSKTPGNLGVNFAANMDVPSPAPVVVIPRGRYRLVDGPGSPSTNTGHWQVQIACKQPFVWVKSAGRNLLVEVRVYGNTQSNQSFAYHLDSLRGGSASTSYLWSSTGPTAASGSVSRNAGLVVKMLGQVSVTGLVEPFGAGCQGTGGKPGVVLPSVAATSMGNYNNIYGVAQPNQRYHQIFDGAQVGKARQFLGHSLRFRNANYAGGAQLLEFKLSATTLAPSQMSGTFASNITGPQTTVFTKKNFVYPPMVPNSTPQRFDIQFKYDQPFLWAGKSGEHLLLEVLNHSTTRTSYYVDAQQADPAISRLWNNGGVTSTTGSLSKGTGLIVRFNYSGLGSSVPFLGYAGRPIAGQSHSMVLQLARANSAAGLIFGVSDTQWGAIPLPLSLQGFGAPGCSLLGSFDLVYAAPTDAAGDAKWNFAMPSSVGLVGLQWFHQCLVLDPQANGAGIVMSRGARLTLGGI